MKKKNSLLANLLLSLAVFAALLLAMEGALRFKNRGRQDVTSDTAPHPTRVFSLIPGFEKEQKQTDFDVHIKINSQGFREREMPKEKPPGVFRIAFIGDSFAFGWGVEEEETFSRRLEDLLNEKAKGVRYETLNFGVWLYAMDQQALTLKEEALAYSPDLVLSDFYFPHVRTIGAHDFELDAKGRIAAVKDPTLYYDEKGQMRRMTDSLSARRPERLKQTWNAAVQAIRPHSYLVDMLVRRLGILFKKKSVYYGDLEMLDPATAGKWEGAWEKAEKAVREQALLAREGGAEFALFLIPRDVQTSKEEWKPEYESVMNETKFTSDLPQKRMLKLAKEASFPAEDLLPRFRENASEQIYFKYDPHLTPEGHYLTAVILYDFLKREGLVPK